MTKRKKHDKKPVVNPGYPADAVNTDTPLDQPQREDDVDGEPCPFCGDTDGDCGHASAG